MRRQQERQQLPSSILPLPREVRQVADNGNRCDNIGLWLDRFLTVNPQNWEITQEAKRRHHLTELIGRPEWRSQMQEKLNALQNRHEAMLKWYKQRDFAMRHIEAKPVWRFVVGLGAAHVLETGITLHRLFGLPIIPGSALKGAARTWALLKLAEELGVPILSPTEAAAKSQTPLEKFEAVILSQESEREQAALLSQLLQDSTISDEAPIRNLSPQELREKCQPFFEVFGSTERAGSVIFFDAIPLEVPKFQLDIMNPHYPNYYRTQGQNPPADWESPNPVFFLTVTKTHYRFAIAARSEQGNRLLDLAEKWLKGALADLGIGAKTSADYGFWDVS
jgi:CRISPR type III-B/RAMP module RAMP protein Cmr6